MTPLQLADRVDPRELTDKQRRMLAAGKFHFTSNRDDADNHRQAGELERLGLITIHAEIYPGAQETVYNCTVTKPRLPRHP